MISRACRIIRFGFVFFLFSAAVVCAQEKSAFLRITSASEPDYPPYCFVDEQGSPTGFSVELFRAAAKAMNIEVEMSVGYWNDIKKELAEGRLDALPLVGRTPEREDVFDFTIPYLSLYGGIVVRKENDDIKSMNDLTGKRIAVMEGDNAEEFLRRSGRNVSFMTTPTFRDAMVLLSRGECDAVILQRLVGLRLIREQGFSNLKMVDEPIHEFHQEFCFAVQEGNKDLLALLNEGLALLMADGTFRRLHTRWFAAMEMPTEKIIVGGDYNYPPFEFLDKNGHPTGFTTDLTRAIALELGLDIEIQLGRWSEIRNKCADGEIDILQGMLYSVDRDKTFAFSPPHTVNNGVAVVRTGSDMPVSIDDLRTMNIVVQDGDIMHDFALENGLKDNLVPVDSQEEALRRLSSGFHDCALVGRMTAMYNIEENGWRNLSVGGQPFMTSDYCYAVPDERDTLLSHFTEGLAILDENGEYRRLYNKWLGVYEPVKPGFREIFRYVVFIAGPMLVILAAFLLWTRSLRRLVALRTADLREIEWMLRPEKETRSRGVGTEKNLFSDYGDPVELNRNGEILRSLGIQTLEDIVREYLDLLETSAAVYEKNGDYALALYSSEWCRLMVNASRKACGPVDTGEAMGSGGWLCHESSWTAASVRAMNTGEPVDIRCNGGIHMYAVPVFAGSDIVGAVNMGYGDPPRDEPTLAVLAKKYGIEPSDLKKCAEAYNSRPLFIVELAKKRVRASARLIGEIVERKRVEAEVRKHRDHLEEMVREQTRELRERLAELERFHEATIDREHRMKELRDEIDRLKYGHRGEE